MDVPNPAESLLRTEILQRHLTLGYSRRLTIMRAPLLNANSSWYSNIPLTNYDITVSQSNPGIYEIMNQWQPAQLHFVKWTHSWSLDDFRSRVVRDLLDVNFYLHAPKKFLCRIQELNSRYHVLVGTQTDSYL